MAADETMGEKEFLREEERDCLERIDSAAEVLDQENGKRTLLLICGALHSAAILLRRQFPFSCKTDSGTSV